MLASNGSPEKSLQDIPFEIRIFYLQLMHILQIPQKRNADRNLVTLYLTVKNEMQACANNMYITT